MLGLALSLGSGAVRAAADPLVRVVVHVPLDIPHALPGTHGAWYCAAGMPHVDTPIPDGLLASYARALAAHGAAVHDHFGFGTWTVGTNGTAGVAFEQSDHLEATMHLHDALAVVPPLLRRLRAETAQREALGEIIGVASGDAAERRTNIEVTLPFAQADASVLRRLHAIFGDRGNGGATQYDDARGVHVYSGVAHDARARIEAALRRAGFAYTIEPETFVTVDAPAC